MFKKSSIALAFALTASSAFAGTIEAPIIEPTIEPVVVGGISGGYLPYILAAGAAGVLLVAMDSDSNDETSTSTSNSTSGSTE